MAKDRNGNRLAVGDEVTIIPGMSVKDVSICPGRMINKGIIHSINGEYIMLDMVDASGYRFQAERYGCELWKGDCNADQ